MKSKLFLIFVIFFISNQRTSGQSVDLISFYEYLHLTGLKNVLKMDRFKEEVVDYPDLYIDSMHFYLNLGFSSHKEQYIFRVLNLVGKLDDDRHTQFISDLEKTIEFSLDRIRNVHGNIKYVRRKKEYAAWRKRSKEMMNGANLAEQLTLIEQRENADLLLIKKNRSVQNDLKMDMASKP